MPTSFTIIPQRHNMDCGVVCIAMLLGVSYEEVLLAFSFNVFKVGATTRQIQAAAKRLGKPLRLLRAIDLENATGILAVRSPKWPCDHLVILKEGQIVDTDATLWDADVFLSAYEAVPMSLLVMEGE